MKRTRLILALVLLLTPVLARGLWFYRGIYTRPEPVKTPDYASFTVPLPQTAAAEPAGTAAPDSGVQVLFDYAHGNYFYLTEVESLTRGLEKLGARIRVVDAYTSLTESLKEADALVVLAPTATYTPAEIQAVQRFVAGGGRLLVITDPTRNFGPSTSTATTPVALSSVEIANLLLNPFEITFEDDYLYNLVENEGNFRNVIFRSPADGPLGTGVSQVVLYSAHSLRAAQGALLQADASTLSSLTDRAEAQPAAVTAAAGRVLALGDFTFLTPPYSQVADNPRFIENLNAFLASGLRPRTLADLPYLFSKPVTLVYPGSTAWQNEQLSMASTLKNMMDVLPNHPQILLNTGETITGDRIVLGTLPPREELLAYLKPFGLKFEQGTSAFTFPTAEATPQPDLPLPEIAPAGGVVTIEGLGKFGLPGLGLVLFETGEAGSTLILLADTDANLISLISQLSSGGLAGCVQQGNMAACQLASGGGVGSSSPGGGYAAP